MRSLDGRVFQAASEADCETAAYFYADQGFEVFPLEPGDKMPAKFLGKGGHYNATTDEGQIASWWSEHPDCGVGIKPGAANVVAIDLDGKVGLSDWKEMGFKVDDSTPTTMTPGGEGGYHIYFKASDEQMETFQKSANIGRNKKVEVFGANKYLAETPSKHPEGGRYEPLFSPERFADLPDLILEHIDGKSLNVISFGPPEAGVDCKYCDALVSGVCDDVRNRAEGARNEYLWKSICKVLEAPHRSDWGDDIDRLRDAYRASHRPDDRKRKSPAEIDGEFDGRLRSARERQRAKGGFGRGDCPNRLEFEQDNITVTKSEVRNADFQVVRFSQLTPKKRKMLFADLIPENELTMLAADAGLGKSMFARWVAVELVSGTLDNATDEPSEGSVFWVSSEEDAEGSILAPMQAALQYKHKRDDVDQWTHQIFGETIGGGSKFALDDGGESINRYYEAITKLDDVLPPKLLVIDTCDAFLGANGVNSNNSQDVKRALGDAVKACRGWGVSVLIIDHIRKGAEGPPHTRILGSVGKGAVARSCLSVGYHPDHRDKRLVCLTKGNFRAPLSTKARSFWQTRGMCDVVTEDGMTSTQEQMFFTYDSKIRFDYNDIDKHYKYDDEGGVL